MLSRAVRLERRGGAVISKHVSRERNGPDLEGYGRPFGKAQAIFEHGSAMHRDDPGIWDSLNRGPRGSGPRRKHMRITMQSYIVPRVLGVLR
jgi:hypothetical protein